jgi:presenilin 1
VCVLCERESVIARERENKKKKMERNALTKREYADAKKEVHKVLLPVSVAIWTTVLLVEMLRTDADDDDDSARASGTMAASAYDEKSTDSTKTKVIGSMENAFVFVLFVTAATFGLYLLFKHRFGSVIWAYMAFSGFSIFGVLGASVALQVLQRYEIHLDVVSFAFYAWNATVVGVLSVFLWPGSLRIKQGFLVLISVIVAYYFVTQLAEWTTWTMLVFMAIYDLYAVLTPNGPLRKIVELSQEREEAIPALVYEARGGSRSGGGSRRRRRKKSNSNNNSETQRERDVDASLDGDLSSSPEKDAVVGEKTSLLGKDSKKEDAPHLERFDDEHDDEHDLPEGIKLGLGDFIFYSVLVGRAAMQSLFCAVFCYVAVVTGLIVTLAGLALHKAALPALPVSIALGVITFVSIKFLVEPAVVYEFGADAQESFPLDFAGTSSSSSSSSSSTAYALLGQSKSFSSGWPLR